MADTEVQVGEYVRTNNGDIFKVANFYQRGSIYTMADERGVLFGNPKKVVKEHDFNIIKLIEVGDYVNGSYIQEIKEKKENEMICLLDSDYEFYSLIRSEDIKTIVTKEQFKSIEYVVGEEDD